VGPRDRAEADEPRVRHGLGVRLAIDPALFGLDDAHLDALAFEPLPRRMPAGCSRSVRTTTSPGSQSMAPAIRVIPSVVLSVRAISSGSAPTKSATRSRTVSYVSKARLYGSVVAEPYSWSARNSDAASTTYSGLGPCAPKLKYAASPSAGTSARSSRGSSGRRLRVPPFRRCALRPRR